MANANPLHPLRYLHTIHAAPECERLRHIYTDVFGGIVFHESYYPPEDRDAALLYVADHMIEVMSPRHVDDMNFMYARYLAKNVVAAKLARRCEVQVAYAIGVAEPVSLLVNTFGTGVVSDEKDMTSSPAPPSRVSMPWDPLRMSLSAPPNSRSVSLPPIRLSFPAAP